MFAVTCSLLVLSTVHLVIHIIGIMDGLILYRDSYQGGPTSFLSGVSQWTSVSKNYVYTAQTLLGNSIILHTQHRMRSLAGSSRYGSRRLGHQCWRPLSRIWHLNGKSTGLRSRRSSQLRSILRILIDAGAIY
ncbi:hypothetical protein EV363DRAFT_386672 [Boletus edulis]|nr:hypothetical protein EV363DRAFT_386672 [Boletus edulis]